MSRRERCLYVLVPLAGFALYFPAVAVLPDSWTAAVFSENGPIELGTAFLFLASCIAAVRLLTRHGKQMPPVCRAFFALFAVAALFITLEELSYGQHLLGFHSPEWFEEHNKQQEMNLHNLMGSKPSRRIRAVASFGYPAFFAVLPLVMSARGRRREPGDWAWHVAPRGELIALVIIAQAVTLPNKWSVALDDDLWLGRLGEMKEFLWAIATYLYIRLIHGRHLELTDSAATEPVLPLPARIESSRSDRRAA